MSKRIIFSVCLVVIFICLSGCTTSRSIERIEASGTFHNYDFEMISKAIENHSDFPNLSPDETYKEEIVNGENKLTLTYTSIIEIVPHDSNVKKTQGNVDVWVEDSIADYFITLVKEWKNNEIQVKSYWKYRYIPSADEVVLVESEDNDHKINQ